MTIFLINVAEFEFAKCSVALYFLPNKVAIWSGCQISFCGINSCRMAKLRNVVAEWPTLVANVVIIDGA